MIRFILRRLLVTIPVLFGIVFLVFALARLVPGDPAGRSSASVPPTPSATTSSFATGSTSRSRVQFGALPGAAGGRRPRRLDQAFPAGHRAADRAAPDDRRADLLRDDLGDRRRRPARARSPPTGATRRSTSGTMVFANFGVSMPVFVLGLLLAFLFAIVLKDTPFSLPALGPAELRRRRCTAGRGLGPRGPDRARRGRSSTSCRGSTSSPG